MVSGGSDDGSDDGNDDDIVECKSVQENQIAFDVQNHVVQENHVAFVDQADDLAVEFPIVEFAEHIVDSCESPSH